MTQHQGACLRGGARGGFPPGTAAASKHETGTVTKQTTDAPQFMVAFALRGGGRGNSFGNISHFVVPWEAGGPSSLKPARLSRTLRTRYIAPVSSTRQPCWSKHDKGYCVKARDTLLSQSTRHMQGQTNKHTAVIKAWNTCCVKARDRLLCQNTRHSTAAVSKHETGTMTKQTTGALQFMVAFALRRGGGGQLLRKCIFAVPWEAGGPSPLKPARLSRTPQNTIHRCCVKHETTLLCPSTTKATVSKQGTHC